jgi:antitoxin (DNA-binding transcriptional repressor) of toxin-antitoxin stability system
VITRHGRPIAELIPYPVRNTEKIRKAILGLKEFQKSHSSGDANIQGLIEEGRKD